MASMSRPLQPEASRQNIEEIFLRARVGIDGDCHASPIFPRQISLASTGACDYCDVPPGSLREDILTKVDDLLSFMISFSSIGADAAIRLVYVSPHTSGSHSPGISTTTCVVKEQYNE